MPTNLRRFVYSVILNCEFQDLMYGTTRVRVLGEKLLGYIELLIPLPKKDIRFLICPLIKSIDRHAYSYKT